MFLNFLLYCTFLLIIFLLLSTSYMITASLSLHLALPTSSFSHIPWLPFNPLSIATCIYMCVNVCTYIYLYAYRYIYATDWICSALLLCAYVQTVWAWTAYARAHSWRILILLLSATIDHLNPMNKSNDWMSKMFKWYDNSTFILGLTIRFPSIIKAHKNRRIYRPGTVNLSKYPWLKKSESLEENLLLPISISRIF